MAGDVEVCKICTDNFIVNSKFLKCDMCNKKFRLMCVNIKDTWLKIINESTNLHWFCDICKSKWHKCGEVTSKSEQVNKVDVDILRKEIECLNREKFLVEKLLSELEYSNNLQRKVINTYEEKFLLQTKNSVPSSAEGMPRSYYDCLAQPNRISSSRTGGNTGSNVANIRQSESPLTSSTSLQHCKTNSTLAPMSVRSINVNVKARDNNSTENERLEIKNNNRSEDQENISSNKNRRNAEVIDAQSVQRALLQAQQGNIMRQIQELGLEGNNDKDGDWQTVNQRPRRRTRKFMVGRGVNSMEVQAIPKYTSLHVTRLKPKTKPEDLEKLLKDKLPEVKCELLKSKHPDIYSSMKVTIAQEHYKQAWNKEVWPNGALVSRFFEKRRVPLQKTVDPQSQSQTQK